MFVRDRDVFFEGGNYTSYLNYDDKLNNTTDKFQSRLTHLQDNIVGVYMVILGELSESKGW